jgi:hypothetical protein
MLPTPRTESFRNAQENGSLDVVRQPSNRAPGPVAVPEVAGRRSGRYPSIHQTIVPLRPSSGRGHLASDVMRAFRFSQGARIQVKRGSFPMAGDLIGKSGVVLELDDYRPGRYGVVLDTETEVRDFSEDELEPYKGA